MTLLVARQSKFEGPLNNERSLTEKATVWRLGASDLCAWNKIFVATVFRLK